MHVRPLKRPLQSRPKKGRASRKPNRMAANAAPGRRKRKKARHRILAMVAKNYTLPATRVVGAGVNHRLAVAL